MRTFSLMCLLCPLFFYAQYLDVADVVGVSIENVGYAPSGFSAVDFNRDGLDDLTFGTDNNGIYFFQNNGNGFDEVQPLPYISGAIRAVQWLDIDGDTDLDFFANRYLSFPVMYRNDNEGGFTDMTYTLPLPYYDTRTSSVSWADYNRDGLLDAYFCNYYMLGTITNWLLRNDGNFTFMDVTEAAGVSDSVNTSYQSMWIDYDLDGWIDLYVSNDRLCGNGMYRNLGDGTFQKVDNTVGLNVSIDGMGVNFDDYDNDLDYDVYVANTANGSVLLRQDNGVFSDVAPSLGVHCPGTTSWGVQWTDAANDGLMDLYVVNDFPSYDGNQNYFFYQTSPGVFQQDINGDFVADDYESYPCGEFDFNQDGYMDVITVTPAPADVQIWQQDTGSNNWIRIALTSDGGNTFGVGANIMVFFGDQVRLRSTHIGESYYAQNPYYENFGIGTAQAVDSVAVLWPSGQIQMYYDLVINATNTLAEQEFSSGYQTNVVLCGNDSVVLYPGSYAHYHWSNDLEQPWITVSEAGIYEVTVTTLFGGQQVLQFEVETAMDDLPDLTLINPQCSGDATGVAEIEIVDGLDQVIWDDGDQGFSRSGLAEGIYPYVLTDIHGCQYSGIAEIIAPEEIQITLNADSVCAGGMTEIQMFMEGGTGVLNADWGATNPLQAGEGIHTVLVTDEYGCTDSSSVQVHIYDPFEVSITAPVACFGETVSLSYEASGTSPYYDFDFDEVDPQFVSPGEYLAVVNDAHFCAQIVPFTVTGSSQLFPELVYDESSQTIEVLVTGGLPPYAFLWSDGSDSAVLHDVNAGSYQCAVIDENGCEAGAEISVVLEIDEENDWSMQTYPVPFGDHLWLMLSQPSMVQIYNVGGACMVNTFCSTSMKIDTAPWPKGVYFIRSGAGAIRVVKD